MYSSPWYGISNDPSCTSPEKNKPLRSLVEEGNPSDCQGREHIEPALPLEDLWGMAASPWYGTVKDSSCSTRPYENSNPLPHLHPRTAKGFIDAPSCFDVLFGKGKALREHTGNVRANHLVAMHRSKYEQADKYEKTDIAKRLVNMIQESSGRFLKFDENEGCWVEVGPGKAREKISHIFRNQRDRKRRNDRN
jgi:hypothetical protein